MVCDMITKYVTTAPDFAIYTLQEGSSNWTALPDTNLLRAAGGCGVATNSTGHTFLVVAGGAGGEPTFTIEVYDFSVPEWKLLSEPISF